MTTRIRKTLTDYENQKFDGLGNVQVAVPSVTTRIDTPTSTATYVGIAEHGTNVGSTGWIIKKIVEVGSATSIVYADGVSTPTKEWDERASYTY